MPDEFFNIKKEIINELGHLGSESYLNPQKGKIFTAILMDSQGSTQEELMILTNLPRTIVSENLAALRVINLITIKKRPNERKKRYYSQIDLQASIRLYLTNILIKFKENTLFSQKILHQLDQFPASEQNIPSLQHFKDYLMLFHKQNEFVIQYFERYLNGTNLSPKMDNSQRNIMSNQLFSKLYQIIESNIKNIVINRTFPPTSDEFSIQKMLDLIKKNYIDNFRNLMEQTEKNSLYPTLVNFLYIEFPPPSQERILSLLDIPRSTLSEALKKVEGDRLIFSIRFQEDNKLHYFPRIPRNLLLSSKFAVMINQLIHAIKKMEYFLTLLPNTEVQMNDVTHFLQHAIKEYNLMIDFLFELEFRIDESFSLNLFK